MSSAKRNEEDGKWESPFPSPRSSMVDDVPSLLSSDDEDVPLQTVCIIYLNKSNMFSSR